MRAFIAVDVLSEAIIAKLQNDILSTAGWNRRDVKPVDPRNFHFTIIFLGEISDEDIEKIKEGLTGLQFEAFAITYTGVGGFPKPSHARVIWLGIDSQGAQRLTNLANDVITEMSELGFRQDKPFSPHLTLFRAKSSSSYLNAAEISSKYQGRKFESEIINKVHLKKSVLSPSGPTYSNVYTIEAKK
ncbi:MAG: RNA 2',3'-cyclic phosphodiesterase [Nitrososphaera sp.]